MNWKDKITFIEFNMYAGGEPNTLEERKLLLAQEIEFWNSLKDSEEFWTMCNKCKSKASLQSVIEDEYGYLVDKIYFVSNRNYSDSMYETWKEFSLNKDEEFSNKLVQYGKIKLSGSTYALRGWEVI